MQRVNKKKPFPNFRKRLFFVGLRWSREGGKMFLSACDGVAEGGKMFLSACNREENVGPKERSGWKRVVF